MSPLSCLFVFVLCCVRCASPPLHTVAPSAPVCPLPPTRVLVPDRAVEPPSLSVGDCRVDLPSLVVADSQHWVCRKVGLHISITKQNHNNYNIPNKSHQIYPIGWCFGTRRITPRIVINHAPAIHPWTGSSTFYSGWQNMVPHQRRLVSTE